MRYTEFLNEAELFELKMSPNRLDAMVKAIPGALVGMEFELIVPGIVSRDTNVASEDDYEDADYDEDRRPQSIDDIVSFFCEEGVGGEVNSERQLRRKLQEAYQDWMDDDISSRWDHDSASYTLDWIEENTHIREEAMDAYRAEHPDAEDSKVDDFGEQAVQDALSDGTYNDDAYDAFCEDYYNEEHEDDWMQNMGYRSMQDVANDFDNTDWPYRTSGNGYIDPDSNYSQLALEFMRAIGADSIGIAGGYHDNIYVWDGSSWEDSGSDDKPGDIFVIEPDGSLRPDNEKSEFGLEFVSPPMSPEDMKSMLIRVNAWCKKRGAYASKKNKTAVHMNISVPKFDQRKLDYVKLVLFMADKHVLEQFDRLVVAPGQTNYAESAFELLEKKVKREPALVKEIIKKIKNHMDLAANKSLHSGTTSKFTSANVQDNRVEFRGPGGNYLEQYAQDPNKLLAPMMRFIVALDAACDPDKYAKEYQVKLYKFLDKAVSNEDALKLFTEYAAGKGIDQSALKAMLGQRNAERKLDKALRKPSEGIKVAGRASNPDGNWVLYKNHQTGDRRRPFAVEVLYRFNAANQDDADIVRKQFIDEHNTDYDTVKVGKDEYQHHGQPGEYEQPKLHQYEIYDTATGRAIGQEFGAITDLSAREHLESFRNTVGNPERYAIRSVLTPPAQTTPRAADGTPQATAANGVPMWVVYRVSDGETVHTFAEHNIAEAKRKALAWLREQGYENPTTAFIVRAMGQNEQRSTAVPGSTVDRQQQRAQGQNYEIFRGMDRDDVVAAFVAADDQAAIDRLRQYRETHPGREYNVSQVQVTEPGQQPVAQEPQQWTGQWLIKDGDTGQTLYRFGGIGNNQGDANRHAAAWLRQNAPDANMTEIEVVPEMQ